MWVIVPDAAQNAEKNWNWGYDFKFLRSLPRWDWDGTALNVPSNANAAPMLMAANADDILFLTPDEDVPVLMSAYDVPTLTSDDNAILTAGAAPVTITVSDVTDEEQVAYLVLSFPEDTFIDLSQVTVSKDGDSSFSFTPVQIAVDPDGTIRNGDSANIISDVLPLADGTGSELVLIIKVGTGTSANGAYTVNLGSSDSQIQPVVSMSNVVSPPTGWAA